MLFDFSEPERNTARRALEIYVSNLREEIVKTERHEWRQALHEEKELLEGVIEQLSICDTRPCLPTYFFSLRKSCSGAMNPGGSIRLSMSNSEEAPDSIEPSTTFPLVISTH
jgi:hypothetical protein